MSYCVFMLRKILHCETKILWVGGSYHAHLLNALIIGDLAGSASLEEEAKWIWMIKRTPSSWPVPQKYPSTFSYLPAPLRDQCPLGGIMATLLISSVQAHYGLWTT